MTYLLVIILTMHPPNFEITENGFTDPFAEFDGEFEQHIAIVVPDKETCEMLRDAYVHAVNIQLGACPHLDWRVPLIVSEVRCEQATDDS